VYDKMKDEGRIRPDGWNVKYHPDHGPLSDWKKLQEDIAGLA